jgi:hypothetical protein
MATDPEIRELNRLASELITRLDVLTGGTADQLVNLSVTARRNRRMIWALALSMALDLVLTVAVTIGFVAIGNNQQTIQNVRTAERRDALCPLYQQFINADTAQQRETARKNGQDLEKRDEAFRVIRKGYETLNCKEFEDK